MARRAAGAGVQVAVVGLNRTLRSLKDVDRAAPRTMRQGIAGALQPIRLEAAGKMPTGPGPTEGGGDNRLPHVRDTLKAITRGSRGVLRSTHPGAGVVNFGGTIRPHGGAIRFPTDREAVYSTVAERRAVIARVVRERIERIGRGYGL